MKTLSLIRHAKAEAPAAGRQDLDRALIKRGQKDCARIAKVLRRAPTKVDLIVASPAVRTQETAAIIADGIGYELRVLLNKKLYEATPDAVLEVLTQLPEDAEHVAVIGHNPSMEGVVSGLCAGSPMRLNLRMPTATLALLRLELYWWKQIRWGSAELQTLLQPKLLRK